MDAGLTQSPSHETPPFQERKFLQMVSEAGVPELACHEVPRKLLQPLVARYETALSQLEKTVKEEQKLKAA